MSIFPPSFRASAFAFSTRFGVSLTPRTPWSVQLINATYFGIEKSSAIPALLNLFNSSTCLSTARVWLGAGSGKLTVGILQWVFAIYWLAILIAATLH